MGDTSSSTPTLIGKLDIGDPLYLHPSDSSALTIVNIKLKGTENYSVWSSAMKLALEAKNKYGFIHGKCVKSENDPVLASQWDRCNSVVLTWLLNSISEELFLGQVFSKLASEVWTDLKESFYRVDGSIVYHLYKKINSVSQNGTTVAEYYNKLTTMWKQFDAMLHLPTCSCQLAKDFNDFSTLIKLMQFLMGLDDVYQSVRTNLLTRDPLPSVKVAFSVISREESHRMSSTGSKVQNVSIVSKPNQSFDPRKKGSRGSNIVLKCTHCNMLGHTVDRCFEIIGYPPGFKRRANNNNQSNKVNMANGNKTNSVNGMSSSVGSSGLPFTSEQIAKLLSLVGEKSGSESQNQNVGGENFNVSYFASCSSSVGYTMNGWIVDSGASQHMVKTDTDLINVVDVSEFNITVGHPNGTSVKVLKIGDLKLTNEIVLRDVFYVPGYSDSSSKRILMSGRQDCGLYFVGNSGNLMHTCFNSVIKSSTWHSRLGHPSDQVLAVLKQTLNIQSSEHGPCDICHRAKQVRVPFPLSEHKSKSVGDLIHLDVWGPYKVTSYDGYKYFLTVDDYSRAVWCYFLSSKTEVFENIKVFYELVLTQFKKKIKIIRSDNGTEFVNNQMHSFCISKGILHQTSCAYTPQQNGVVERKHGHLLNTARALMFQGGLPLRFWSDCVLTAVYLINRLPSYVLNGRSPFEMMFEFKPSFIPNDEEGTSGSHDPVSGDQQPLSPSTSAPVSGVEVGQQTGHEGSSGQDTNEMADNTMGSIVETNQSEGNTSVRKSSKNVSMPKKFGDFVVERKVKYGIEKVVTYAHLSYDNKCFVAALNKVCEPTCYDEAAKDDKWVNAMNSEMEALYRNNTWVLVDLPKGRKPIGCKWVFKVKYKANGEIERYKARLVAKGFNQREGLDFGETFSPVVKMTTVRIVLKLAVNNNWPLYQMDVNNAFLYGMLSEDVYMTQPQGYSSKDNKVCKLVKSLYGLKQAPRQWNEKLTSVLTSMGFVQSICDYSLFVLSKQGVFVILLVYVDDIVITGNDKSAIENVKSSLRENFHIKDLGLLRYFLGIEVLYSDGCICLSQRKYCLELLNEFGYLGCKPVTTPIEQSFLVTNKCKSDQKVLENVNGFQRLIGKLIYLSLTRPDISYAVQFLSQFMHSPCQSHLDIALRLLRYLKLSPGKGFSFKKSGNMTLTGFVDSDWAKCLKTRRSVTGYGIFLGETLVSWKSKKQNVVSRSTAEAEYRAMCSATCEIMWILNVLSELKISCSLPVKLYCDSKSAISISQNPAFHERTKHFELDLHFLREKIAAGIVEPEKVSTNMQVADIFTKGLNAAQHQALCEDLCLYNMFAT
ncbi:putative RNA-directed DNA polymerase [Helianthus annuus]|uniref:RNA-directed DNA polymerase n=1 Tax=Helianthus annuus TaxID=4232 RepID=A0A9K3E7G5_HELAN|nr:putative RNA-directed DNA polymerase [Helianthus annuus]KAJ0659228.1 putative RNA-directed DNA polymerase [Helianthus annuus]KAJ0839499.1 putative RNA-directed DNA polymerase [Helianthus annuus]